MSRINNEDIGSFIATNCLTGGVYGFCYGIGNFVSAHHEFRPSYYKGLNIIIIWIALKKFFLLIIGLLYLN